MLAALTTLVKALPEIISLIQTLKIAVDKQRSVQQVKEDLGVIQKAFASGDAAQLNDLFNRK